MDSKVPIVAILASPALKGSRSVLRGIFDYAERHGPWRFVFLEGRDGEQMFDLAKLACDAVVVNIASRPGHFLRPDPVRQTDGIRLVAVGQPRRADGFAGGWRDGGEVLP